MRFPWKSLVFIFVLLLSTVAYTQDTSPPAPTNDSILIEVTQEPTADIEQKTDLSEPFLQEDLSVLVGNVQRPNGIVWFNDKLYTQCNGDWTLYEVDSQTGSTITYVFGVRNAHTMYAEGGDTVFDLWIPDFDLNSLVRVDQNRGAPDIVYAELDGPWGIASLNQDDFLITNFRGNNITKVSRSGAAELLLTDLRSPSGIQIDEGVVYFANTGSARRAIEWIDLSAESPEILPLVRGLQNVTNLLLASDGYLYFTYALGTRGVIGRVDPEVCRDGGCNRDEIQQVVVTELPAPLAGLSISEDMRLFVHTIYRPEIYWVQLPSEIESVE